MFVLLKESYADFDIPVDEVIAVSENLGTLQTEAARLNALRKQGDFVHGEWNHTYKASSRKVKVL